MKNGIYTEIHRGWVDVKVHYKDDMKIYAEYPDGGKEYYKDGLLHKEDGPAEEYPEAKYWHLNGEYIPVKSQEEFERYLNTLVFR